MEYPSVGKTVPPSQPPLQPHPTPTPNLLRDSKHTDFPSEFPTPSKGGLGSGGGGGGVKQSLNDESKNQTVALTQASQPETLTQICPTHAAMVG